MYGILDGEPFQVFARRSMAGTDLVIRFECKEGMGILGIRKTGRQDPPPSSAYEEENIEPGSLRAGRFVHVLQSGQRQSYALSRISSEVAGRLPTDAWVELKPQTEYGFRYLIVEEGSLPSTGRASASIANEATRPPDAGAPRPPRPTATPGGSTPSPSLPPQPQLTEAAVARLSKEQALEHLRAELARGRSLEQRLTELQSVVQRSKQRERDLLDLLAKWQGSD